MDSMQERANSFFSVPDGKRRAIAIGACLLLIVIILIVILLIFSPKESKVACTLTDTEPTSGKSKPRAISSQDGRAVVRFAGHLKIWFRKTDDFQYLDLSLGRVRYFTGNNTYKRLALDTDCALITIQFAIYSTDNDYMHRAKRITIRPKTPGVLFEECNMSPYNIGSTNNQYRPHPLHYVCVEIPRNATDPLKQVRLDFRTLELKLDADAKKIAVGEFYKTS